MGPLWRSELLRFRRLAIVLAVVHFVVLRALSVFGELYALSVAKLGLGLLSYALLGLLFGLYQLGTYRRLNRWTYLIHRPLPPGSIFLALTGAAAVLAVLVVAVPLWLATLYLDLLSAQWVDARHYLLALFLVGTTLAFYLVGAFVALSPSKAAILVVGTTSFFLTRSAHGLWVFVPLVLVLAWLAYVVYASFKPNLQAHLRRPLPAVAQGLGIGYALFGVLFVAGAVAWSTVVVVRLHGIRGFAVHGWDTYFDDGTIDRVGYMRPQEALVHGLRGRSDDQAEHQRRQLALAETSGLRPTLTRFADRGQLFFMDRAATFRDPEREIVYRFAHDPMLYRGTDARTGGFVGWLGTGGPIAAGADAEAMSAGRFDAVPFALGGRFLVRPHRIDVFDPLRQSVMPLVQVGEGESFLTGVVEHETYLTVLSDHALYFFDRRDLRDQPETIAPFARAPLPGPAAELMRIDMAELLDGHLLSFVFGTTSPLGFGDARQVLAEVGADGRFTPLHEQALAHGAPALLRYRGFVASPAIDFAHRLAWALVAPERRDGVSLRALFVRHVPVEIVLAAVLVALGSALLTWWLGGRRLLTVAERRGWVLAALLFGAPALLAMPFVTARREQPLPRRATSGGATLGPLAGEPGWSA